MFTSHDRLKRRTPEKGINRREYIGHLVDEYHTTTDIEAQEQVTANLANFAYDPINWAHLKAADALQLFVALLSQPNESLQRHAVAGLCNICLDPEAFTFITTPKNFSRFAHLFLKTEHTEIVLDSITLLYQLATAAKGAELKALIATSEIVERVTHWQQHKNKDQRLINVASILLEYLS